MFHLKRVMLGMVLAVAACTADPAAPTTPRGGISIGVDSAASFATSSAASGETSSGSAGGGGVRVVSNGTQ